MLEEEPQSSLVYSKEDSIPDLWFLIIFNPLGFTYQLENIVSHWEKCGRTVVPGHKTSLFLVSHCFIRIWRSLSFSLGLSFPVQTSSDTSSSDLEFCFYQPCHLDCPHLMDLGLLVSFIMCGPQNESSSAAVVWPVVKHVPFWGFYYLLQSPLSNITYDYLSYHISLLAHVEIAVNENLKPFIFFSLFFHMSWFLIALLG